MGFLIIYTHSLSHTHTQTKYCTDSNSTPPTTLCLYSKPSPRMMCGRARSSRSTAALAQVYGVPPHRVYGNHQYHPRHNLHPGQVSPIIVHEAHYHQATQHKTHTHTHTSTPTKANATMAAAKKTHPPTSTPTSTSTDTHTHNSSAAKDEASVDLTQEEEDEREKKEGTQGTHTQQQQHPPQKNEEQEEEEEETWTIDHDMGTNALITMHWGLIPTWQKSHEKLDFFRAFNARAETLTYKPFFRRLVNARRCLVPFSGFYEWVPEKKTGKKQPFYVHYEDDTETHPHPLSLAGLYDVLHYTDQETGACELI